MRTITVRDLRNNFSKIEAWLEEGEKIRVEKRGQPIAIISAVPKNSKSRSPKKPDFRARLKALWGRKVFSQAEVEAMRAAELKEDEG